MLSRSIKSASTPSARRLSVCYSSLDQALQGCFQAGDIEQALLLLSSSTESSPPSYLSYLSLLKACNSSKKLAHARDIHRHLALHNLHLSDALGNPLIVTLAKCGALEEALTLFHNIAYRTVYSWTAIISAYTDCGRASDALQTYTHMLSDDVQPDLYTFVSLFKACGNFDLNEGMRIHADAYKKGLTSNVFAGCALLSMYGKCQYLAEAEHVFWEMPERDSVSWIAMFSAYVDMGFAKKALLLYRQMQEEENISNRLLFVLAFQACGCLEDDEDAEVLPVQSIKVAALDIGQAVHAEARRRRFTTDVFVGSALVNMYGKCGSMENAEDVFLQLPVHDLANWNSMLSAKVEQGQAVAALLLYRQLHKRGMTASKVTILIALQACTIFAEEEEEEEEELSNDEEKPTQVVSFHLTQAFREDVASKGLTSDGSVGSALINLCGKCGNLPEAEHIFSMLPHRNVVAWTAMMSAYFEQGEGNKVLQLYRQMWEERLILDQHTYVLGVQACSLVLEKLEIKFTTGLTLIASIGQSLHSEIRFTGYAANIFIGSALISMYSKSSSIAEAENVFTSLCVHNVVSWSSLLSAYAEQGEVIKILQLYCQMLKEGIVPDGPVFVLTLKACTTLLEKEVAQLEMVRFVSLEIGRALHADCKKLGFASDIIVAASLLSMYGNCGAITDAEAVFVELPQRSAFICGSMMSALIEIGQSEKAIQLYKHASVDNVLLDDALFSCLLRACSDTGNLEVCREVHFNITSTGLHRSLNLANSLAHTYGSCSSMVDGQLVAEEVLQPDVVTWSACIANFVQGGNLTCLEVLSSMQDEGIEPGATTFLSVLTFCSHAGLRNEGLYYLLSMSKDYGIVLNSKHFLVLTDLLGRAGDFKRIENFLGVSSMINNVSIWLVLLAACSRQGNTELGGHAFKRIMELQPKEAAAYVLMANTSTETSEVEESYVIWQSDVRYLLLGCIRRGAWLYAKALSLQLCLLCATLSKRTIMCYSFANVQ